MVFEPVVGNEAPRSVDSPIGTMHLIDGGVIPRAAGFPGQGWTDDFRPARKTSVFTDRQEVIA
jgi:hypothetical protein